MSKVVKSKQDCVKYIMESTRDYKINCNDHILFYLCQENMKIVIANANLEEFILRNDGVPLPTEPLQPTMHPDYHAVAALEPALAEELSQSYARACSRYLRDLNLFQTMRDRINAKQLLVSRVFSDHFGPSILSIVATRLRNRQFFEALHELEEHFLEDSMQKKFRLNFILSNMYFEFCITMPLYTQLLDTLTNVHAWLNDGVPYTDQAKVICLVDGVRNGEGNFDFALDLISMGHVEYSKAVSMLIARAEDPASRIKLSSQQKSSSKRNKAPEIHQAATPSNAKENGNKKGKGSGKKSGKKSTSATDASAQKPTPRPCFDFSVGKCSRGDSCKYVHDAQNVKPQSYNAVTPPTDDIRGMQAKFKALEAKLAAKDASLQKTSERLSSYKNKLVKAQSYNAHARATAYNFSDDSGDADSNHVVVSSRWSALESDSSDSESDDEEDYKPQGFMAERGWRSQTAFPSPEPSKISGSAQAVRDFVSSTPKIKARMVLAGPSATEPVDPAASAPKTRTVIASSAALNARVSALLAKSTVVTVFSTPLPKTEELGKNDESDSSDDDFESTKASTMFRKVQTLLSNAEHSETGVTTAGAKAATVVSAAVAVSAITVESDTELQGRIDRLLGRTQSAAAKLELQELLDQGVIEPVVGNASDPSPATCNILNTRRGSYAMVDTLSSGKSSSCSEINMVDSKQSKSDLPSAQLEEIVDTGATDSMRPNADGLANYRPIDDPEENVHFGGHEKFSLPITGRGVDETFSSKCLVVPGITRPLLSGTRLMSDGYIQLYYGAHLYVYSSTLELVASGTLCKDRLVHRDRVTDGPGFVELAALISDKAKRKRSKAEKAAKSRAQSKELASGHFGPLPALSDQQFLRGKALNRPRAARELVGSEMRVLHNRTMHAGRNKLMYMLRHRTAVGACVTLEQLLKEPMGDCTACHLAKFGKFPAPASFSQAPATNMLVICSDLEGPFRTRSVEQNRYWQLHVDAKSGFMFINFHKTKATAAASLMALQNKHADPLGLKIRYLQSDSDAIYKDVKLKQWAEANGVELQYTAPYRHEGRIEAHMKAVLEMVRTVLADSGLAEQHWQTLAEAAVQVLNRLPTSKLPTSCPLTELTGKIPDISNLVPLGYPATCKIYDEEGRTTLEANGQQCNVVGYCEQSRAYKVVTKSGRALIRKDVVVDENFAVTKRHSHTEFKGVLQLEQKEVSSRPSDDSEISLSTGSSQLIGTVTRSRSVSSSLPRDVAPTRPPSQPPPRQTSNRGRRVSFTEETTGRKSSRQSTAPDRLMFNAEKTASTLPPTPRNMREALQSKSVLEWLRATNAEMQELLDRGVIEPVKPGEQTPPAFKSKIVYRVSKVSNPLLEDHFKFKARVVACGYSSIFGVHYEESYSPTMLFKSLLIVLSIAQLEGWTKTNIDIGNAYLEAQRTKPLYMWLPTDWTKGQRIKVKLARNLYGLKDAGLLWYVLIDKILQKDGYKRSIFDPCVYFKGRSILCLYVDDLAITGKLASEVARLKKVIASQVKLLKDLGTLSKFVGIEIEEVGDHLCLSQLDTANAYVQQYVKSGRSVRHVPIDALHKLDQEDNEPPEQFKPIWDIVGKLRYLADHTRHDLQYVSSKLGTKSASASPRYQEAAIDAMAYLQSTAELKLKLGGKDKKIKLFGYADASFIAGADSKSQLGYCFFLTRDSGAVCARSIKDKTVSLSSTESELKALTEAIKEAIWMRGLLGELGYPQEEATLIFQDNTSAIRLAEKFGSEGRTRHIVNRINFIRQELLSKTVRLEHIPTKDMVADILTGPRALADFEHLRGVLLEGHQYGKGKQG